MWLFSITYALHNENLGFVDKSVGNRGGDGSSVEYFSLVRKRQIRGNHG